MGTSIGILVTAAVLAANPFKVVPGTGISATKAGEPVGFLYQSLPDGQGGTQSTVSPYVPREGDIIFFDDRKVFWDFLYWIGGTAAPFHAGIVVKRPDGNMGILESGPDDTLTVFILDAEARLSGFTKEFAKGHLQVRQCKAALTPQQSKALTDFAVKHEGKRYAWVRLLLQGTHFRKRGSWFEENVATTHIDRHRWLCCEIVVSAAHLVGLIDGKIVKAEITYPLDIVDDHRFDLSPNYLPAAYWAPTANATCPQK